MERRTPLAGPRMLLKRLRDTMARGVSAEETLGEVVRLVANEMVAEVCSIYILRAGEVLELFATQGLNPSAVHRTRLRVGEGLVGDIAAHGRPLALDDAQTHPQFAYRPETGEEVFHSLAGVPILRAGRVLGVLVVQNRTRRQYDEEEVETLQTIAMVLAEMVAAGHFVSPNEVQQVDGLGLLPLRIDGVQLTPGVAIGRAVLHEPRIVIQRVVAEDVGAGAGCASRKRSPACATMSTACSRRTTCSRASIARSSRPSACSSTIAAGASACARRSSSGLTAEAAVQRAFDDMRARMGQSTDPYIRERLTDLQDLTNRLLLRLTGRADGRRCERAARRHDRDRARHGAGRAARLRPRAPARSRARGRLGDQPCRDRGARARHSRRRPRTRRAVARSRRAIRSWSTATTRRCWCGRARTSLQCDL